MREFYVYALFRPNGVVCYIGKGKGDRINRHERFARRDAHHNPHLLSIIKKAGGKLPKVIVRDGLLEDEAFEFEAIFIRAIGRETDGGPLVNMTYGGEGPTGLVFSESARALIGANAKICWADEEYRATQLEYRRQEWENPALRAARLAPFEATRNNPELEEKRQKSISIYWKTADRANHGKQISAGITDAERENRRQRTTEMMADPEFRARAVAGFMSNRGCCRGRIRVTNGILNRTVDPNEIPDGWWRGLSGRRKETKPRQKRSLS